MTRNDRVCAHVYVSGRVQGVYFRANTRDEARRIGVDGWVKNLADGRVEAMVEGDERSVAKLVKWCHEGSPSARVESVDVEYVDPPGFEGFEIRYD